MHHLLPHLVGEAFAIQKCESLFPGDGAALFTGQSHHEGKCDFRIDSLSIPLLSPWVYSLASNSSEGVHNRSTIADTVLL